MNVYHMCDVTASGLVGGKKTLLAIAKYNYISARILCLGGGDGAINTLCVHMHSTPT